MPNYTLRFRVMGSWMQVWVNVHSESQANVLQQVPGWFVQWEGVFSRFRQDSELSQLNQHAGEWVVVSPLMIKVITAAMNAAATTNGYFNPLILTALKAAGYDHNFDGSTFIPGQANSDVNYPVPRWQDIDLIPARNMVRLPPGSQIDLGGIVKGWAAQRAADWLFDTGPCLVDAGGDMVAHGSPDDSDGWLVTVESPTGASMITLNDSAIATSGTDYRRWHRGEQTLHHLIDPRTGQPANSGVLTSTIITPDGALAETWAKAALISAQLPDYPAFLVFEDGRTLSNAAFEHLQKTTVSA